MDDQYWIKKNLRPTRDGNQDAIAWCFSTLGAAGVEQIQASKTARLDMSSEKALCGHKNGAAESAPWRLIY